jgi:Outer membrane protein beta-barrel domain
MDENRPENIDKLFRDSLQSSQREPSNKIWENVERELNEDDRRSSVVRFRIVYLLSACLLVVVGSLWLLSPKAHKGRITLSDKSGPAAAEKAVTGGAHTNGSPGTRPYSGGATHTGHVMLTRSGEAFKDTRFIRPGMVDESLPQTRPVVVSPQRVSLTSYALQPDPNHRLLTDQLSRFKRSNSGISPHWPTRWSVTGYFSKEFAGYNLSDHDSLAANGREVDKKERPVYSASAVVLVNYNLKGNWVLQSGLSYSWSNSIANPTTSYAVNNNGEIKFKVNTVSGYGYLPVSASTITQVGDSVITGNSYTKLHYLTMPFIVAYRFRVKKFTVMAGLGLTLNLLTGATLETKLQGASYSPDEVEVKMYGLKKTNYGALVKVDLQYPIYRNWSVDLVTSFKNTLTPINLHTVIATYPYNLGIGLGIIHAF